jgi:YfiR/HmsC-like
MSRTASARGRRRAGAVLTAFLLCASTGGAQDVTESSLKAAMIYNFAKFTDWPEDILPAAATFTACVLGDVTVRAALERNGKARQLSGRDVRVSQVELDGKLRSCNLLYVSGVTPAQVAAIVAAVQGAPVLTISDLDDFSRSGGIVHMFVESGNMRFDLNLEVAKRSRLQLSSKLLVLAAHVNQGNK